MTETTPSVAEVERRIKEAMRAQRFENDRPNVATSAGDGQEFARVYHERLRNLEPEVAEINRRWHVVTDTPIISHKKVIGKLIIYVREWMRKTLRWYIDPPIVQQREFNKNVSHAVNHLRDMVGTMANDLQQVRARILNVERQIESGRIQTASIKYGLESLIDAGKLQKNAWNHARENLLEKEKSQLAAWKNDVDACFMECREQMESLQAEVSLAQDAAQQATLQTHDHLSRHLQNELTVVADRIRRVERRINRGLGWDDKAGTMDRLVEEDKQQFIDIDYFLFAQRFRGTREEVKNRQRLYVDRFKGKCQVLDIGCGRGEFVELLHENGIGVTGIDRDGDLVAYCQDRGLPVLERNLFEYMGSLTDQSLDGIFSAQLIEQLKPQELLRLLRLAHSKLKPAGVLILEAINPLNPLALPDKFYLDLGHLRPVHPLTLQFIVETEGFKNIQLIYPDVSGAPRIPKLRLDGLTGNLREFNDAIEKLNERLYGPADYAMVAIR